jgi:hypothetical protein
MGSHSMHEVTAYELQYFLEKFLIKSGSLSNKDKKVIEIVNDIFP